LTFCAKVFGNDANEFGHGCRHTIKENCLDEGGKNSLTICDLGCELVNGCL